MVESTLDVGGGVVFWSLAEWSERSRLEAGLRALGLAEHTPEPRQPAACLREALTQVLGGPRVLVRPLSGRDGFAVVREDRGSSANNYRQELTARVLTPSNGGTPGISLQPAPAKEQEVRDAFVRQLGLLHAGQLSAALVGLVDSLGGTRLRPSGALYWLPAHRLDEWLAVSKVIEGCAQQGRSAVYLLRHRLDAEAVRAVQDAIVAEVQSEARRIHNEVMSGELGGRALEARQSQAQALRQKVSLYEDLLSVGLGQLHGVVDQADQAAAAALLLASAAASAAGANGQCPAGQEVAGG